MIVCLCRGVSEHAIYEALAAGAATLPELTAACQGAGGDCGTCQGMLTALLAATRPGVRCALEPIR
jgi:bacterioferritin-associated ferredoxin